MFTFSEHEKMVLKIIGRRKMTIHDITMEFYHSQEMPVDPGNYIGLVVRRIKAKCQHQKLGWTLHGTKGRSRGGRTIWRGKRKSGKS